MLLEDGRTIKDIYEVERYLGQGAFAEVYRVKHKFLGRQAMKVFKTPSTSVKEVEQKLNEATILSRIGHPNIIRVFDAGVMEIGKRTYGYFTMEYVAGGNLESFWQSYQTNFVPIQDTLEIIRQVCAGLSVAHSENPPIVHRDIKPQNILIGYDANGIRIRIGDFGLAKQVNPLTLLASAAGTPAFKPPEFVSNFDSCSGDVWAIGVVLYLLLTDHLPFQVLELTDFYRGKSFEKPLIPPSRYNIQVDDDLEDVVKNALAIEPSKRYADANELLRSITGYKPAVKQARKSKTKIIDSSKDVLQSQVFSKSNLAQEQLKKALDLSKNSNNIMEAADLLEEALNNAPELRGKYEDRLRLWRRGIVM